MKRKPSTLPDAPVEIAEDTLLTCARYPGQDGGDSSAFVTVIPAPARELVHLRVAERWHRPGPRRRGAN